MSFTESSHIRRQSRRDVPKERGTNNRISGSGREQRCIKSSKRCTQLSRGGNNGTIIQSDRRNPAVSTSLPLKPKEIGRGRLTLFHPTSTRANLSSSSSLKIQFGQLSKSRMIRANTRGGTTIDFCLQMINKTD